MEEEGTRYATQVRQSNCTIDQLRSDQFALVVQGKSWGVFPSAKAAREKIVSILCEEAGLSEQAARLEVPMLSRWKIERTAPFDPEEK